MDERLVFAQRIAAIAYQKRDELDALSKQSAAPLSHYGNLAAMMMECIGAVFAEAAKCTGSSVGEG